MVIETNKDAAKGFVDVIKSIQEKEANALIAELKNTTEANKRQAIKQRLASYGYQVFEIRVNGRVETIVYSSEGKLVGDKPGATKTEITPDGTEIRINVNDEKLEFRPDNTFVKYDKDGNIIKTDIWKDINGTKMTLTEAEYDWGSDHMGRRTIEPNVLEELNKFIDENKDNIGFQKQREIINRVSSQVVGFETISEYGKRIIYGKNAGGQTVKSTVIEGELVTDSYFDGLKVVDQTFVNGKLIGSSVTIPSEKKVYLDAKGKAITEKVFNNAVNKAKQSKPTKTAYSHETNNTQTTKKNSYIAPETKNGEMTTGSHVMANSSLKSSDYLSNANRLLHPKNYELAKMLSDCGIQLEIGVDGTFHAEIPYPSDSLKDINPKTNMLKELWRDYGRYNDEIIFNVSFNKNNKCIRIYGKLENADMYEYKANDPFLGPINQDHARAFDIMSALVRKITDGEKLNMRAGLNDFLAFCKRSADIQARRNLEDAANSIINTYNITNLYYKEIESIVNMHLQSEDYSTDEISEIVRLVAKERDFRLLQMTDRTPKQQEIFERSFNVQKQKGTNPDDNAEVEVVLSENYFNDEGVNVSIVSDTYAQLVENPLFISLENNSKNRRIQIDTGIYQIQREPSGDFLGNKMKREEPIIVDGTAKFRLAGTVELDLNSPAIKNILDGLYPGEEVNVGRSALITIENAPKVVSKNHLTIKKLADNTYEVTDVSKNGTEINLAHNGVVEVLSCDDKEPSGIIDIDEQRRLEEERQRFEQQRRDEEEALGNAAMQQELNDEFYNSSDNPESYCPDDIIDL